MPSYPLFDDANLEAVCRVLADTNEGLTGTEIGRLLDLLGISDLDAVATKWKRLHAALSSQQQRDRCGNQVMSFILEAMKPVRYANAIDVFDKRREELNRVLVFAGLEVGADGQLRPRKAALTLTEAEERAGRLRHDLRMRAVNPDVLRFCRAELLQDNYFHAVLEATKSVADKIREKTGLTADGSELVDLALSLGKAGLPLLAFNSLQTESEQMEQRGLVNLLKGMFGTFRNPVAHAPKVAWDVTEQDALDLLTMASFLHRRLDQAVRTPRQP